MSKISADLKKWNIPCDTEVVDKRHPPCYIERVILIGSRIFASAGSVFQHLICSEWDCKVSRHRRKDSEGNIHDKALHFLLSWQWGPSIILSHSSIALRKAQGLARRMIFVKMQPQGPWYVGGDQAGTRDWDIASCCDWPTLHPWPIAASGGVPVVRSSWLPRVY